MYFVLFIFHLPPIVLICIVAIYYKSQGPNPCLHIYFCYCPCYSVKLGAQNNFYFNEGILYFNEYILNATAFRRWKKEWLWIERIKIEMSLCPSKGRKIKKKIDLRLKSQDKKKKPYNTTIWKGEYCQTLFCFPV